jgi:glycosyltransferase involved in cell wall biosynthesis
VVRKLLVIIPCYNEEASIGKLLQELSGLDFPPGIAIRVAVVNDCSEDKTAAIAMAGSATVLDLPVNLGIGGAMQTGYLFAHKMDFDLAVQMDGDGQHPPAELIKLLTCYEQTNANVVIGSRFLEREGFQSSRLRRTGIRYLHWLNRIFSGKRIYDCTSGFRLFDKKAISIAAANYPDEYPEPEAIVIFAKRGLVIHEVPVVMKEREEGKSSITRFSQLYYIIKVSIAMFFSFVRK